MSTEVIDVSTKVETDKEVITETETKDGAEITSEVKAEVVDEVKTEKEIMIPKERFDEVNDKYKELAGQFDEIKGLKEKLEAQVGTLTTETTGTKSAVDETNSKLEKQVEKYDALLGTMYSEKLKTVPEDFHEIIPQSLTTEEKLSWITKAEEKGLFGKKEVTVTVGQPLNHSAEQSTKEAQKRMNPIQLLANYYGVSK